MTALDALLEGFAAQHADPPSWGGRFTSGDKVRVSAPGGVSIVGHVRRPSLARPATHVVVAPEGGHPHVEAPVSSVRLDSPQQHAAAQRRAQQQAVQSAKPQSSGIVGAKRLAVDARGVIHEAFAPAPANPTVAQSDALGARQVSQAQAALRAGWNPSKHPRATGGKFGYTTGGKRATRSSHANSRTLGVGSRGALVASVQRQLGLSADGVYGQQTHAAVARYQRQHHLQVDGVIGRQTLAALRGHVNPQSVAPGAISSAQATVRPAKAARVARAHGRPAPARPSAPVPARPPNHSSGGLVV